MGAKGMALFLSFRNGLVGCGWAASVLLCTNELRKQSPHLVGFPFLTGDLFFPSLVKQLLAERHDYCKLVNGWVWFESQTCRGWLHGYLCEQKFGG